MIQRYYVRDSKQKLSASRAAEILKIPHITEKTSRLAESEKKLTFIVDAKCNKCDIAKACKVLFNADVKSVNTITQKQKKRHFKQKAYIRPDFKKAIVSFESDEAMSSALGVNK